MGITSLQVCMDSSDWLQGTISEEYTGGGIMDSSPISTPSGGEDNTNNNNINNLLGCSISPPLMAAERRLRPQHEQSPKCPRCESTHTKFCYYNNYSLSQPRYFCKTCRRYWTKGGTLRNIPVGGGCRKNKKVSSSSSSASAKKSDNPSPQPPPSSLILNQPSSSSSLMNRNHNNNTNDDDHLHLGFPDQLHFSSLHASGLFFSNPGNFLLESNIINNPTPIEFMDNKYDNFVGNNNGESFGGIMAEHNNNGGGATANTYFHGFPFGFSSSSSSVVDHSAPNNILESCQRLMMPYDHQNNHYNNHHNEVVVDVKPNSKILSLEWNDHHHQQQSATTTKDPFGVGYNFGGLGSWTGLMNGYGSSATNPLV